MRLSVVIPLSSSTNPRTLHKLVEDIDINKYEIVCVYDGEKVPDVFKFIPNIIGKPKSGISDTINIGLKNVTGDVVCIINDDISILTNKFETTLNKFKDNPKLDILVDVNFSLSSLAIRTTSLKKLPYWFEQYYFPCDVEKFIITARSRNLNIEYSNSYCSNHTLNRNDNINRVVYEKAKLNNIKNQNKFEKLLTCIIPFKNEKYEVEKTINSILATTKHTEIIIINDNSDDGYDYDILKIIYPNIKYIKNTKQIGHSNIDLGVVNSSTKYSILIDAHMRFYQMDWDMKLINILKDNPKSIIYGNTSIINRNKDDVYKNEDNLDKPISTIGAGVQLDITKKHLFRHFWAYNSELKDSNDNLHITPNILGACYAFANEWYNYIGGTYGLMQYGLSEACLAVKTWLMGGNCMRLQSFIVGHVYRKKFPYKIEKCSTDLNTRFLIELLIPDIESRSKYIESHEKNMINNIDFFREKWDNNYHKLEPYIKYYQTKFVMDLETFNKNINSKFS